MRSNDFDPLEYIEKAFLDRNTETKPKPEEDFDDVAIPSFESYIGKESGNGKAGDGAAVAERRSSRFKKTTMSAPRPRRVKGGNGRTTPIDPDLQQVWEALPRSITFLCQFYDDSVTEKYYTGEFKETRKDLIKRLLDPQLSLEETSRLLGVCPATVRRYTNRGWLTHHRTQGGQRRFRLSDIAKFVEQHGRFPEE